MKPRHSPTAATALLRTLATGSIGPVPMPFVLLIVVAIVTYVLLHRSVYGRYLYAVGRNEEAARYSGINAQMVMLSAYVVEALLVALAGILFAFYTPSISPAQLRQRLRALRHRRGSARRVQPARRRRLDCRHPHRHGVAAGVAQHGQPLGIPSSLEYSVMGAVIFVGVLVDQIVSRRKKGQKLIAVGAVAPSSPAPAASGTPNP